MTARRPTSLAGLAPGLLWPIDCTGTESPSCSRREEGGALIQSVSTSPLAAVAVVLFGSCRIVVARPSTQSNAMSARRSCPLAVLITRAPVLILTDFRPRLALEFVYRIMRTRTCSARLRYKFIMTLLLPKLYARTRSVIRNSTFIANPGFYLNSNFCRYVRASTFALFLRKRNPFRSSFLGKMKFLSRFMFLKKINNNV